MYDSFCHGSAETAACLQRFRIRCQNFSWNRCRAPAKRGKLEKKVEVFSGKKEIYVSVDENQPG